MESFELEELTLDVNQRNGDPRVACVVLADVSYSMVGAPIEALTEGYALFCQEVSQDPLTRKRAEIGVITFGSQAQVRVPMQEARELEPIGFEANGTTNLASALQLALDMIEQRKAEYKDAGLSYFRPWIMVLTDGMPDLLGLDEAVDRLNRLERANGVTVFPIGVGGYNSEFLARLSTVREPAPLAGLKFKELFLWLSNSLTHVSHSNSYGRDDDEVGASEKVPLATPSGWMNA